MHSRRKAPERACLYKTRLCGVCHQSEAPPRGRFAPSPTGRLHLGNAFAFLAAWLSIRKKQGRLILRMEDIDPERSRAEYAQSALDDLRWLGLGWDEGPDTGGPCGPYVQSRRLDRYAALLDSFASRDLVYPCFCTRKELRLLASAPHIGDEGAPYPGLCRGLGPEECAARRANGQSGALRLDTAAALAAAGLADGDVLRFDDAVQGLQEHSLADCGGDFALRRSDGVVAYQLAVAADDADMAVSEVVRGADLLLSTPRQLLLFSLLGKKPPRYAHIPLLCDSSGERLAKRHKSLELVSLRAAGVRPEAITGYLGYLAGWLAEPRRATPEELLEPFRFATLAGRSPRLPDNIAGLLLQLPG